MQTDQFFKIYLWYVYQYLLIAGAIPPTECGPGICPATAAACAAAAAWAVAAWVVIWWWHCRKSKT